jgi:ketosteroid isomerase-like protein
VSEQNVETVRAMFETFQHGDEDALLGFADPDVEIRPAWDSISSEVGRGREAFLAFWRDWPNFWHDYGLEPREFVDAGDRVLVVLHERGRSRPGATEVEDEFAHIWTVRDGKVTRADVYSSRDEGYRALGR